MADKYNKGKEVDDFAEDSIRIPQFVIEEIISHLHKMNPGILGQNKPYFDSMLDAGCGNGLITKSFASYFRSIIAFDISEAQIEKAKELNPDDNMKYVVGPGEVMPADDKSVDFILSVWAPQYFDMKAFSHECKRVLKANGCATLMGFDYKDIYPNTNGDENIPIISGIDLFLSYINGLHGCLLSRGHPDADAFSRFSRTYSGIVGLNKERNDDVTFDVVMSLAKLKRCFLCIPAFLEYHEKSKDKNQTDPFEIVGEKLKKRWNVPHLADEDVELTVTLSVFLINIKN